MNAQIFWGSTMAEAMEKVSRELGDEAMILATEETAHPTYRGQRLFCITATPGLEELGLEEELRGAVGRKSPEVHASPGESQEVITPAQAQLLAGLMNQLQVLHAELAELRNSRKEWEKTTQLCRELRREVNQLSQLRADGRSSSGMHGNMRKVEGDRGVPAQTDSPIETIAPLWDIRESTCVVVQGPEGSGRTTTAAKIAAEAADRGLKVAMIDLSGSGKLERMGNRIGVPTWNVPGEGSLESVLTACEGLDLVLIDADGSNGKASLDSIRWNERAQALHFLTVVPADGAPLQVENALYACDRTHSIALSKLDQKEDLNGVLAVLKNSGYPVSHVCTGKGFPGSIRRAVSSEMTAMTMAA